MITTEDKELLNKINNKLSFVIAELEKRKDLNLSITPEDLQELKNEVSLLNDIENKNEETIEELNDSINKKVSKKLNENHLIEFIDNYSRTDEEIKFLNSRFKELEVVHNKFRSNNFTFLVDFNNKEQEIENESRE